VVALAGTAMPFAHSAEDEAERWLRALRLHGQVGAALQSLGVGEAPLMPNPDAEQDSPPTPPKGGDVLDEVTRRAGGFAAARDAETVGTPDLLFAVFEIYGELFDRVLYLRGTSREELTERLEGASERHPTQG
jgi:hypothetical protein